MHPIRFPVAGLGDGVITLRVMSEADKPALVAELQDPEIARYTAIPTPYGDNDAAQWLAISRNGIAAGSELHPLIVDTATGALLGSAGIVQRPGDSDRWSVGYWVAASARGNGYAERALRLLCPYAFSELGAARIELCAEPANLASQRTAERAGFTREGILRQFLEIKGRRRDMIMFSLLPRDGE